MNYPPGKGENEYDALLDAMEKRSPLQSSSELAKTKNPDELGKAVELARRQRLPLELIERNVAKAQEQERRLGPSDYDKILDNEKFAKWLTDVNNMALAKGDLNQLHQLNKALDRGEIPALPKEQMVGMAERATIGGLPDIYFTMAPPDKKEIKAQEMFPARYAAKYEELQREEAFIQTKGEMGFIDALDYQLDRKGVGGVIPFVSGGVDAAKAMELYDAAKAYEEGNASQIQQDLLLRTARMEQAAANRGTSILGGVGDILFQLPAFVGEFAATGGVYRGAAAITSFAGRRAVEGVLRGTLRKVLLKSASRLAGGVAQTAAAMPFRAAATTYQRMTPQGTLGLDEDGTVKYEIAAGSGEKWNVALPKALVQSFSEIMSERAGYLLRWADKRVNKVLFGWWGKAHPGASISGFQKFVKEAGVHGALGEMGEEEVGKLINAVGQVEPYRAPTGKELASEALAFSVLPLANELAGRFKEIGRNAKASKLMQRSQSAFEDLVAQVTAGTPEEFVHAPVALWNTHWQAAKNEDGTAASPKQVYVDIVGTPDAAAKYDEASRTGSDLVIPTSRYAVTIAPSEHNSYWQKNLRFSPMEMTAEETEREIQELEAEEKAQPKVAEGEKAKAEPTDSVGKIESEITAQLKAAGYFPKDIPRNVRIFSSLFRVLGERTGADPYQLFKRKAFNVQRVAEMGEGLAQPLKPNIKADEIGLTTEGIPEGKPGLSIESPSGQDPKQVAKRNVIFRDESGKPQGVLQFSVVSEVDKDVDESKGIETRKGYDNEVVVYVAPEARRKGIATKMYDFAKGNGFDVDLVSGTGNMTPMGAAFASKRKGYKESAVAEGKGRGFITIGESRIDLNLLQDADLSTFLHETSHFWLDFMGQIAEEENAPQEIKDDFQAALKHIGATDRKSITKEQQETWARSFELYLREGKAPSAALRTAFYHFKKWLTAIYSAAAGYFKGISLTPEVRGVFDRMLATDTEITQAEVEHGLTPLFENLKDAGATDDFAKRYAKLIQDNRMAAEEAVLKETMKEIEREQTAAWKEEREKVKEQVTKDVDDQPIYRALSIIRTGHLPNGDPILAGNTIPGAEWTKLDKRAVEDRYGSVALSTLPADTVQKNGMDPEVAASILGYDSGAALVDAIGKAENRDALIDRLTDERMAVLHPQMTEEEVHDEAVKQVHKADYSRQLAMELELLAKNPKALVDLTAELTSVNRVPQAKALEDAAHSAVERTTVSALNPKNYERAEMDAGRDAKRALKKGDINAAIAAKRRQLINHVRVRIARAALEEIQDGMKLVKKLRASDDKLSGSRDIDLVNAARAILASYGLGVSIESAQEELAKIKEYDPKTYETIKGLIDSATVGATDYRNVPVGKWLEVLGVVDALWNMSKELRMMEIDGKKQDIEAVRDKLKEQIDAIAGDGGRKDEYHRTASGWEKFKGGFIGAFAFLRRAEAWAEAMGKDFIRNITDPIHDATTRYRKAKGEKNHKLKSLLLSLSKTDDMRRGGEIIAHELTDENGTPHVFRNKWELMGAILHSGNDSNLSKLLRGYGWGKLDEEGNLDRSKWDSFFQRMIDEGVIQKQHMDAIQSIWDMFEELKPEAWKAHRHMEGYYPKEVEPGAILTPWGVYKGGYAPAIIDPIEAIQRGTQRQEMELDGNAASFRLPTTGKGFTKSRSERFAAPLLMDLRMIPRHLDWVLRYTHIEPRVREVYRLINHPSFKKAIAKVDPNIVNSMLLPWLDRAANQRIEQPIGEGSAGRFISWFFRNLRKNAGAMWMFLNFTNALQNYTGIVVAKTKIKPKYLRNAQFEYMKSPLEYDKWVRETSSIDGNSYMVNRMDHQAEIMQQETNDLLLDDNIFQKLGRWRDKHTYVLQAITQNMTDKIVWGAAFEQAVEENPTDTHSNHVRDANRIVRTTQGAGEAESVSRAEAQNAFVRQFTHFMSYFNMKYNLGLTEYQKAARGMGIKENKVRLLYVYLMGFAVPAVIGRAIFLSLAGKLLDDDDDDGYLDTATDLFLYSQATEGLSLAPILREGGGAILGQFTDQPYDDRIRPSPAIEAASQALRSFKTVPKAISGEGRTKNAVMDAAMLLSLLGVPVAPLGRAAGYLADVEEGYVEPENALDFIRGTLTGKSGK